MNQVVSFDGVGQFQRDQRVTCKPGALCHQAGIGRVKDVVWGYVVVYFEGVGAVLYYAHELESAERVPLATPVTLCNGVQAFISGHSTADCNSYRVSWFDRHYWQARHKWTDRVNFEVVQTSLPGSAAVADNVPVSAA
jgi:hypothetical protein